MTAIRLKQAYKKWPIGHVIPAMPGNVARLLIARGIGEELQPEKAMQAPNDRMMRRNKIATK